MLCNGNWDRLFFTIFQRDFSFPTTNSAPPELPPSRAGRQTAVHRPQDWASPLDASFRRPSAKTSPLIGCPLFL
uniref:Uncharacterized protein n=1 Tax=Daphnia galeata TaxID=27404 RepID=A0A8J2RFF9_9CRUS|nr:unnamed protein product [Daphnia galeata]